jgi:predicted PurR-regulated permease PerM
VITFFGSYVPFIGATVSGFVAVLLAVADSGLSRGVLMLSVVIAVQLLEGNVFQPWIQGRAVRLHPLVVALSVTAAGVIALSELRAAGVIAPRVVPTAPVGEPHAP